MYSIPDATLRAVDFVFDRLAEVGFDKLNTNQKYLVCVWAACGEVDNGGIWQFFFNTSGDWSTHTPAALEVFDAPELAEIIRSAMTAFPKNTPHIDMDQRRQEIDAMPDQTGAVWEKLGDRFDTIAMDSKIDAFIRNNEDSIYTSRD